jgi:protein tyrosine phosphatase
VTDECGVEVRALLAAIKTHQDSMLVLPEESIYGNAQAITEHAIVAQTKPLLVHDAAGVGRTGAFLALHISLKKLEMEGKVRRNVTRRDGFMSVRLVSCASGQTRLV